VANGEIDTLDNQRLNFIVVSVELVSSSTYEDIVSCIAAEFKSQVARREKIKELAIKAWDFVSNWKVMGVEYKRNQSTGDDLILVDSLCEGISTFIGRVGDNIDGILILNDEADKPAEAAKLGEFCKLFSEKMTKLRCEKVCIGIAGLPSLVNKLKASHESSPRIFETLALEPLEPMEREEVVRKGLEEAKRRNGIETTIDQNAMDTIVGLSEGYPHFIQQFAYSAFEEDQDNNISLDDVNCGAFKENGALDQLGKRYFSELYFDRIGSEDYRRVLNSMADKLDGWISRAEIIKMSGVKETQVTNALKALRERQIILPNENKQGEYRLPTKSFAVWIKALNSE